MSHATPDYYAHPTAILDEGCQVGRGSRIWHFCHISAGADLGEDCNLGQNVFVADGVTLGRNVKVQNNVSLYGGVVCEDDVFLGPHEDGRIRTHPLSRRLGGQRRLLPTRKQRRAGGIQDRDLVKRAVHRGNDGASVPNRVEICRTIAERLTGNEGAGDRKPSDHVV